MFKLLSVLGFAAAFRFQQPAGDPECKLGHRSFTADPKSESVCCPAYCGECSDYASCSSVNGQESTNACCATKVLSLVCENNAEDPYCLKSCSVKSAPCSLGVVEDYKAPEPNTASEDCGEAVKEYKAACKATVEGAGALKVEDHDGSGSIDGAQQWKDLQDRELAAGDAAAKAANPYKKD